MKDVKWPPRNATLMNPYPLDLPFPVDVLIESIASNFKFENEGQHRKWLEWVKLGSSQRVFEVKTRGFEAFR